VAPKPGLRQRVDEVATQFEQTGFKNRKEAARTGADDEDVR
jgi:hypothetical protein